METLKTAFYQRYGGYTVKILPETSADNVKMGQDTVADRILALERGGAALPEAAAAREVAQEALQLVASQSARLEELEAGVEVAGQRLALVDDKADEALEAAQGAVAKVLQNSQEIAAAAAEIGEATARLEEAAEVCADLSGRTGAIGEQAEAATAAVQGFAADLAEQGEGLSACQGDVESLAADVSLLKEEAEELAGQGTSHGQALATLAADLEGLQAGLATCQSGLATQGAELSSLTAGLEEAETAQAALTGELADLRDAVDSLDDYLPLAGGELGGDLSINRDEGTAVFSLRDLSITEENKFDGNNKQIGRIDFCIGDKNYAYLIANVTGADSDKVVSALNVQDIGPAGRIAHGYVGAGIDKDNAGYAYGSHPRGLYGHDLVTEKSLKDYASPRNSIIRQIHVFGANASDTADINNGRGLSAEKPFASLGTALAWFIANSGRNAQFILHGDGDFITGPQYYDLNGADITIVSDNTRRTLNVPSVTHFYDGALHFENIDFSVAAAGWFGFMRPNTIARFTGCDCAFAGNANLNSIWVTEGAHLILNSNSFSNTGARSSLLTLHGGAQAYMNGSVDVSGDYTFVIHANVNGAFIMENGAAAFTGSATGKRFSATNGGRILVLGKGPNALPGSEAGTTDSTSVYA